MAAQRLADDVKSCRLVQVVSFLVPLLQIWPAGKLYSDWLEMLAAEFAPTYLNWAERAR